MHVIRYLYDDYYETIFTAPEFPGFRTLCPTRWTVRASSLESVLSDYEVFLALWDEAKDIAPNADARMCIARVQFQMTTFNYLFGTTYLKAYR